MKEYSEYIRYCRREWKQQGTLSENLPEYGLGRIGYGKRCDILFKQPLNHAWNGIWNMKDK